MRTLTLDEASTFLRLPTHEIITRIKSGHLPAAQLGNELLFIDTDLADYLRGHYHPLTQTASNFQQAVIEKPKTLFGELVPHVLRLEENRVRRHELTAKTFRIMQNKLDKWVMPYFEHIPVAEIDYLALQSFIEQLTEAEIKGVSISQYLIVIRKVLNYAHHTNVITSLPQFPKVKTPRTSRGAFTIAEYRRLRKTAWRMREQPYMMQNRPKELRVNGAYGLEVYMPRDMARLIGFMVNSFIRPSDLKFIQHKHIEIIAGEYNYLRLSLPETKKHDQPIVTLPAAVGIYTRLFKEAKAKGYGKPNDYLFMPELAKRRDHALRHLGFLFSWVLEKTSLKYGPKGQTRTLYCLRHTAITYRLLYGEGVDLLTLAKNARTSVIMIERHYASTLNGEMNIGLLHSKRTRKSKT
jgi:hypothetical protein